jgi:hypothetical protein
MTTAAVPSVTRPLNDLRRRVAGTLHTPSDPTWDAARTPWSIGIEQNPLAVLEVRDTGDVQAAVRWAADHDVHVTAQPSGHGANDDLAGVLLLRTRSLGGIAVDLDRRTVRVGAGVKAGEALAALDGTGLTFLSGSNPDPSVVGLTIGGGMSWFGRAYGLGANSIVSVELVDAFGRLRHLDRDTDPDLFWAIRGCGGDFGIVTAIGVALHPAPAVYGGRLFWPLAALPDVLGVFRTVTESAPPELTVWAFAYRFPALPFVPEALRGKAFASIAAAYLGGATAAERLLAPFRAIPGIQIDQLREIALADLGAITEEPTAPSNGKEFSCMLDGLSDETIDRLTAVVGADRDSPLALVQIRHLGDAFTESRPDQGAAGHLVEPYMLFALGITPVPPLAEPVHRALTDVERAVAFATTGRLVPNFMPPGGDVDRCWPIETRQRLARIKSDVDPFYTIRSNRPVRNSSR